MKENYIRFELSDLKGVPWEIEFNEKGGIKDICCCWADSHQTVEEISYLTQEQKNEMLGKIREHKS